MGNDVEVLTVDPLESALAHGFGAPATGTERALADVLAEMVGVPRVSVDDHFFDDLGADSMVMARFCARVRKRADLPSVSMKDVYQHPTIRSLAEAFAAPASVSADSAFADVLAEVVGVPRVSVDDHFFDDLGADSMVMARFCARVRKRADLPSVSMKDIYRYPTIRELATALSDGAPAPVESTAPPAVEVAKRAGTAQYVLCGVLQLLVFLGYSYLSAVVLMRGFEWVAAGTGVVDIYLRSALFGGAGFLGMCLLPVLVKWLLIGRWKPRRIRIWSLAYVRFWVVKTLVRSNPLVMFVGSPIYILYLRALGAKIGRGVVILSTHLPVCTDMLTIGDRTIIRKDSYFTCYRAHAGQIETGTVTLGKDVFVGEMTVLDIGTSLGDGAQLGHTSSLHAGQAVPVGEHWHGSPAQRTETDYRTVDTGRCGVLRKVAYCLWQLLTLFVVYLPLGIGGLYILFTEIPQLAALLDPATYGFTSWTFYTEALAVSLVLFFVPIFVSFLLAVVIPRLLKLMLKPDRVYPLYGFHYGVHRTISRMTNLKFFKILFGDSSAIVHYLRCIGYDLSPIEQTGSNFGTQVKHDSPFLTSVGSGTVVADGLSVVNADYSSTSFRLSRVSIGPRNFLGNHITYPAQGKTGDNCLLGTKAMIPIDGKVREGVGLLGSPSFEIPRSVERDTRLDHLRTGDELRRRLAAKNRHNAVTMGLFLLVRFSYFFGIAMLVSAAADLYGAFGAAAVALTNLAILLLSVVIFVLVERASTGFRPQRPRYCSIYDRAFWQHERYWKMASVSQYMQAFNGTPFKNIIWRMLGARVGSRVFDDGIGMPERTLVSIGSDCTLNVGAIIQCHSQEDGAFKSDRITIGAGCTLGVGSWVHYGVTMGDGVVLAPDSFLMKGEEVAPYAEWGGNPAREIRAGRPEVPAPRAPLSEAPAAPPVPLRSGAVNGAPVRSGPSLLVAAALFPLGVATGMTLVSSVNPQVETAFGAGVQAPAAAPGAPVPTVPVSPSQVPPSQTLPAPNAPVAPVGEAMTSFRLADLAQLDRGLAAGDGGPLVVTVQQHLRRLGYYLGDAHGGFDEPTSEAVRRFQAAARVVEDPPGTVGRATAVALEAGGDRPEIAVGSRGDDVHRLQHALIVALGQPLQPSGTFGTATAAAVRAYQSSRGLPVDGAVGARTWAALQAGR